jgi:cysteine desulfurase
VLSALGLSDADAAASVRIGLGRFTDAAEVDFAVAEFAEAAARLRGEADPASAGAAGA